MPAMFVKVEKTSLIRPCCKIRFGFDQDLFLDKEVSTSISSPSGSVTFTSALIESADCLPLM